MKLIPGKLYIWLRDDDWIHYGQTADIKAGDVTMFIEEPTWNQRFDCYLGKILWKDQTLLFPTDCGLAEYPHEFLKEALVKR